MSETGGTMSNIIPAGSSLRSVGLGLAERPMVKAATVGVQAIAIRVAIYVDAASFPWGVAHTVDKQGTVSIRIARGDGFIQAAIKLDDIRKHQQISASRGNSGVVIIRGYLVSDGSRLTGASLAFRHSGTEDEALCA